ncbi:hypothetical protein FRUB_00832 [Fimbriiglobus ruber]|uniref:ECF RNA polymerase sigma factor SigE n=2 Tax=Fimbriiglobus ruber TaxID=1908690 RepID=A0A225E1P2_9BACT|nr:hypothetical protein FRUB_00832 [Fimbriiglobus ruber]
MRYLRAALGPTADGPTDADLLGRFVADRDEGAFELLVWRHAGMVLRTCRGVLRDHHAAEDVTQAAFLVLARKAAAIGRREAVVGWLYRVARRLAVRAAARRGVQPVSPAAALDLVPGPAAGPSDDADIAPLLHEEVARLPDRYRLPVLLCYFEGLSHTDAATRLGWPVGTVSGRLARAKATLHDRLTRRGVAVSVGAVAAFLAGDPTAAVSASFAAVTTRAAVSFAAGAAVIPSVSNYTIDLARGAIRAMIVTKFQWAAGVVAACGVLTFAGVWASGQGPGPEVPSGPLAPNPASPLPVAAKAADGSGPRPDPAGRTADFVQRHRSLKNLRAILIAMHAYQDTYARFPSNFVDHGKPLLSWRVQLLPYLDCNDLFNMFKLDEPWDSEHNLKLLPKMPDVFRVGFEPPGATHTYYQRIALTGIVPSTAEDTNILGSGGPPMPGSGGPGPILPAAIAGGAPGSPGGAAPAVPADGTAAALTTTSSEPWLPSKLYDIPDGTSNTLGVLEIGPAVPWTKPADYVFDVKKKTREWKPPFVNVLHAAAYDGAAYTLKPNLEDVLVRRLLGPSDGEMTPPVKQLQARFEESAEEKKELVRLFEENRKLIEEIERQQAEQIMLFGTVNKLTKEIERAEEQQQALRRALQTLKVVNKKWRDEMGLSSGQSAPKLPLNR